MEKAAAALDLDPLHVRRRNLIGPREFPYTGVNQITYDEGSYREALDLAETQVHDKAWPSERDRLRDKGQLAGIGYSCFSERTAYGTPAMSQRRMRMTPGYDTALVRMDLVAGQLKHVAAQLLEASPADVELADGTARIRGDASAAIPIAELARVVHFQAHRLAEDLRYGLEARATFDPPGTFSNACHVAMVVIDPGTCAIRLHRYLVVEDCGVVINPVVVDGQVRGGVTQGAAAALAERLSFDADGQPVTTTLMDYLAPTAAEMCDVDIVHLQTPSRFSETGAKGMGEGGTIGAPAAVLGAINDALSQAGVSFDHIPVLPQDLSAALSSVDFSRAGAAP
jgi:carbon-monoxide dehydrogenase large subunit